MGIPFEFMGFTERVLPERDLGVAVPASVAEIVVRQLRELEEHGSGDAADTSGTPGDGLSPRV
jgi:hypothetical protein